MAKSNKVKKISRVSSMQNPYVEINQTERPRSFFISVFFSCWILSVCSALGVVYSTFETRKATQELEELRSSAAELKVISGKYLLEQSSLGAYSRVEKIASRTLGMVRPGPQDTVLVDRSWK